MRAVKLTYELIKSVAPMHTGLVEKFKRMHAEWDDIHQAAVQEHIRIGKEDLELNTIGTMHKIVLADLQPPEWNSLIRK